jgi:hypothetical protein
MPGHMAVDVHCTGQAGNMSWQRFDMYRQGGSAAAKALWTYTQGINLV